MDLSRFRVSTEQLRWQCDTSCFTFHCTEELAPLQEFIGQDRAIQAISFGLAIGQPGYNIFVTGMTGTGKASVIKAHLESVVAERAAAGHAHLPSDWCYLYNFSDSDRPEVLQLAAGKGKELKQRLERLQGDIFDEVQLAFSSQEYEVKRKQIVGEEQQHQRKIFEHLEEEAAAEGFQVQFSPVGVQMVPLMNGKPATQEEYLQLDPKVRRDIELRRAKFTDRVDRAVQEVKEIEQKATELVDQLDRQIAEYVINGVFRPVRKTYADQPGLARFLDRLRDFSIEHVDIFRNNGVAQEPPEEGKKPVKPSRRRDTLVPFAVNVFVDNSAAKSPPIIVENNPTFANLFGRIDRRFFMGAYMTDHTMLKPGSFQLANGGYLVLDMKNALSQPLVWDTMKRVIKTKEVRPEDPTEAVGLVVPQTIKPEPIPLDVKIVVTGDVGLYNALSSYDDDFWETFKVRADFDYQISKTVDHLNAFAAFICGACYRHQLRHFAPDAVGKVVEYAARLVADQGKLSTRFGLLTDLLIEADYWARAENDGELVAARHVRQAIDHRAYRSNLIAERMREMITEGAIMVDVQGKFEGQVNGLAVFMMGDFTFGKPSRITARTFLGRAGIINIEREAQLSGKTHDKGVQIISGYLGWKYAQQRPLAVSATVAFEQSYSGVDGDSASSTEIYAILSSLAGVPLRQDLAVTGSVNQKGEIQAIGGVNEKIEGFFDLCKLLGLTGSQGVVIPRQNVRNLMLREDVVEAVKDAKFHVYAVGTIDEGIELLTGVPSGLPGEDGSYPEGTVNYRVHRQLQEYSDRLRTSGQRNGSNGTNGQADKGAGSETPAGG